MKELEKQFIEEIGFMLEECEESFLKMEDPNARSEELVRIFRVAHSIKGSAGAIGLMPLSEFAHTVEDCLSVLRAAPELLTPEVSSLLLKACDSFRAYIGLMIEGKHSRWNPGGLKRQLTEAIAALQGNAPCHSDAPQVPECGAAEAEPASGQLRTGSIKLDTSRLDSILDLIGELVVIKSQVLEAFQASAASNTVQNSLLALFDKTVRELQDRTLTMRMTVIKPVFLKLQRISRDLSHKLGKPLEVTVSGEELELDRSMIELLADPLIHIVRNAIDHGLETAESRAAAGKPEKGALAINARQGGGRILIEIRDDGGGIDREKVLRRAVERGLLPSGLDFGAIPAAEVTDLLFRPGFSTAERVTDVSGRGVGLDVVKANVAKLKGTIEIESTLGKGTCFTISLPLTTAITDGIVVLAESVRMILPMEGIREIAEITEADLLPMGSTAVVARIRDQLVPLLGLRELFGESEMQVMNSAAGCLSARRRIGKQTVVVVRSLDRVVGLVVDVVVGQSQVVVKPLGPAFQENSGLTGVAILGDGKIGLVLDIDSIGLLTQAADESRAGKEAAVV